MNRDRQFGVLLLIAWAWALLGGLNAVTGHELAAAATYVLSLLAAGAGIALGIADASTEEALR